MFKEVYEKFVDLGYEPDKDELICSFYIEPMRGSTVERAAGAVAAESSVGTWTEVPGLKLANVSKIAATCFEIENNWIKIAYPLGNFELGSMPQIYSAIAGNVLGMKAVNNLRLNDVKWPGKLIRSFPGPQFGIAGIRKMLKVFKRPLLACVPKPKIGMTAREHAETGYKVWKGGVDFLKDDENLTSQPFNKFEERVRLCMKMREKAEKETGETKSCLFNITSPAHEMKKRAKLVADAGNEYVMVDFLTVGWSALQELREMCRDYRLAIYAHRAFHAAFTRNPRHGVSMLVLAESARLAGVDNIHVGTGIGKLAGTKEDVLAIHEHIRKQKVGESKKLHLLEEDWLNIKPTMSVSSGGLHPGILPQIIKLLGKDIIIQVGGGIHGHPKGSHAGALAARQAVDAVMEGAPLQEYARKHRELEEALGTWGFVKPK